MATSGTHRRRRAAGTFRSDDRDRGTDHHPLTLPEPREEVRYEVADHVATITLDAPERMNTISGPMLGAISRYLLEADHDRDVRCIVLTGSGRAFCAGLDLAAQAKTKTRRARQPRDAVRRGRRVRPARRPADRAAQHRHADDLRPQRRRRRLRPRPRARLRHPHRQGVGQARPRLRQARHPARERRHVAAAADGRLRQGGRDRVPRQHAVGRGVRSSSASSTTPWPTTSSRRSRPRIAGEIAANAPLAVRAIKRMMRAAETETFEQNVHHVFLQLLPLLGTNDFRRASPRSWRSDRRTSRAHERGARHSACWRRWRRRAPSVATPTTRSPTPTSPRSSGTPSGRRRARTARSSASSRCVATTPSPSPGAELLAESFRQGWNGKEADLDRDGAPEPGSPRARMQAAMQHYVDHIDRVPVFILVGLERYRPPNYAEGASVFPAVPEPAPRRPRPRLRRRADRVARARSRPSCAPSSASPTASPCTGASRSACRRDATARCGASRSARSCTTGSGAASPTGSASGVAEDPYAVLGVEPGATERRAAGGPASPGARPAPRPGRRDGRGHRRDAAS